MIIYYRTRLHAKKWPVRIILDKIQAATVNAQILYNSFKSNLQGFQKLPLKDFITEIIMEAKENYRLELNADNLPSIFFNYAVPDK